MPTRDRRLRPRRRPVAASNAEDHDAAMRLMHAAAKGMVSWDEIRPRCIRAMSGRLTPHEAAKLFDAYRRAPQWLPLLNPGLAKHDR